MRSLSARTASRQRVGGGERWVVHRRDPNATADSQALVIDNDQRPRHQIAGDPRALGMEAALHDRCDAGAFARCACWLERRRSFGTT